MTETPNTPAAATTEQATPPVEGWNNYNRVIGNVTNSAKKLNDQLLALRSGSGGPVDVVNPQQAGSMNTFSAATTHLKDRIKELANETKAFQAIQVDAKKIGFDMDISTVKSLWNTISGGTATAGTTAGKGFVDSLMGKIKELPSMIGAVKEQLTAAMNFGGSALLGTAAVYAASQGLKVLAKSMKDMLPGYDEMQTATMGYDKVILQSAVNMGRFGSDTKNAYREAGDVSAEFGRQMKKTSSDMQMSIGEVTADAATMAKFMNSAQMMATLGNAAQGDAMSKLSTAYGENGRELTALNAALLIHNATGMETGTLMSEMETAQLQLGETVDGSVQMFGKLKEASVGSGLSMDKVGGSVIKSAGDLKLWGGTINSVLPVFNMFSKSLGEGRKGLATEMLESFTSGIKAMSFEKRAFLGIQAGAGQRGGALGAGLEMEAALDDKTGKGMEKYMDGLTKTLERYGGGKVISRDEAIKDPGLQTQFILQRKLLEQMMGMDTAHANKLMEAMKAGPDAMAAGSGGMEQLQQMLTTGGQTIDSTVTDAKKEELAAQRGLITSTEKLTETFNGLLANAGFKGRIGGLLRAADGATTGGTATGDDLLKMVQALLGNTATNAGRKGDRPNENAAQLPTPAAHERTTQQRAADLAAAAGIVGTTTAGKEQQVTRQAPTHSATALDALMTAAKAAGRAAEQPSSVSRESAVGLFSPSRIPETQVSKQIQVTQLQTAADRVNRDTGGNHVNQSPVLNDATRRLGADLAAVIRNAMDKVTGGQTTAATTNKPPQKATMDIELKITPTMMDNGTIKVSAEAIRAVIKAEMTGTNTK
jgi:hypothetical protein